MHLVQGVLLALLQREKTGRGQRLSVSLLDSMLAAQTQEAATQLMRGREVNWGAMPLSGVFETSRRRARAWSARSRPIPCSDIGKALELAGARGRSALQDACAAGREQAGAAGDLPRALQDATPPRTGSRGSKSRTCSARRCARLAEALADEQTAINGMIMEATGAVETRAASSARRSTWRTRR